jgi:Mg2+ and Co2+ transporter CorA
MPELDWSFGYWWSWGLIIVTTAVQIVYFRRKRWL